MILSYNDINGYWVYTIRSTTSTPPHTVQHIGCDTLIDILRHIPSDSPDDKYVIEFYGQFNNKKEAKSTLEATSLILNLDITPKMKKRIKCVETGAVYESISQAARELGLTKNALCCHLKGKVGYRSVKGLTFTEEEV